MELGSEFHIDLTNAMIRGNTIYHLLARYNTFYTDYGRSAIALVYEHLVQTTGGRRDRVLLPSYICESVVKPFEGKNVVFYDLKENFEIEEQGLYKLLESGDFDGGVFFLMHYFGMVQPEETLTQIQILCKERDIAIIEDTTHSIFTKERRYRRLLHRKSSQMDADTGRRRYLQYESTACRVAGTGTCQDFLQD